MTRKIILLIFFFTTVHVFSQDNEIGIFAGGSNYIGDVGPTTYISPFSYNASTNYVGGVIFRKNFNERISARAKFNYSKIGSSDNWPQTANYRQQRGRTAPAVLGTRPRATMCARSSISFWATATGPS